MIGKSATTISGPADRIKARSIRLRNSRIFPVRKVLNSIENDSEMIERCGSTLELESALRFEIDRIEKEIDADFVHQPKASVGIPF